MNSEEEAGQPLALAGHDAPHATAQDGEFRELGERLAEFAGEQSIPLEPDPVTTGRLAQVVPANQIPEEVYGAVAALLGFLRDVEESQEQ